MSKVLIKNLIITILIVLSFLSIYFGAYLPFKKSRLFIDSLRTANEIKSINQFKSHFDKVFNFYSPVGDEEVVKFLSSDIANAVSQIAEENVARELVNYIEPKLFQNNVRHLLVGAQLYSILWNKYHRPEDAKKVEDYYLAAFRIGPKLPQVLYGLLEFYRATGNEKRLMEIGQLILSYWPHAFDKPADVK